jgi:fructokinase
MEKSTITSFGEVLWDMLPDRSVLGGAPFNFTYRARSLGNDAVLVSRVGSDELGTRALEQMRMLGIPTDYIQLDLEHTTGKVRVTFDESKNPSYIIIEDVAYDYIEYNDNLAFRIQDSDCICFGSLIQRTENARRTLYTLLDYFDGAYTLFDINLRQNCYSRETIENSLERTNVLKLNEDELRELKVMFGLSGDTIQDISSLLTKTYGLTYCLVTLGDKGVYAVSDRNEEVYVPAFQVDLVDPVGSGDGCAAGFIDALLGGETLEYACRFAAAVGAVVAEQSGATEPLDRGQVEEMLGREGTSVPHPEFA